MYPFVGKDATSNDKTIQGTKVSEPLTTLESVVELTLILFATEIRRSVALYDVELDFLLFCSKCSSDDPWPM